MAWVDRLLAVVNTFTGRPTPTTKDPAFLISSAAVNANFQGAALAVAFCQALGTECTDNTSTAILCKLKPPAGRVAPGDRLVIVEDRPTLRTWCKVATGTAAVPLVEFADADLQDSALAGTADYDTIQADLLLVQVVPLDKAVWPKQAILLGGAHGLTGTDLPWKLGETDTLADKFDAAVGPAGSDTEVQFNDAGDYGGADHLTYDKTLGSIGLGEDAAPDHDRQLAHSGAAIAVPGDHQFGRVEAGYQTPDNLPVVMLALAIPSGKTYGFRGLLTAASATGVSAHWYFRGVIKNVAGTTSLVGGAPSIAPTDVAHDAGAAAWGCAVGPDDGTDTLQFLVTGDAVATVNWGVVVEWEEVSH